MEITSEQIKTVEEILKQLEPGLLPEEIFYQIARVFVTPIVEIVPIILEDGKVKVLLLERPADDPFWGGMLHTPGTIVLSTDKEGSIESAFERILNNELAGETATHPPILVGYENHQGNRGRELALIHWIEMKDATSKVGKYYDIDNLPVRIVNTQVKFIKKAVDHYKNYKSNS